MKKIILITALLATGVAHAETKKINFSSQLFVSSLDGVSMAINDQLKTAAANACGGPNNVALLTDIKILIKLAKMRQITLITTRLFLNTRRTKFRLT